MSHAPDDYALVIGIDHYPEWADGKKSLKGPVKDATDFEAWLRATKGGGLPGANVQTIKSTAEELGPLQPAIDAAFKAIRDLSAGKPRRRFYFYFAGHGHSPATAAGRQALCLANWSTDAPGAALQLESYLNASVGCLKFEEGLFFLDCCRLREVTPLGKASDLECGDPKFEDRHHATFYATEHYQAGYEEDTQDARGYFTRALIAILKNGTIEVNALNRRLAADVEDLAKPRKQVARGMIYTARDIFLGPPEVLPKPDAINSPADAARARLTIRLDTKLDTNHNLEEPPAPPPGEITVHQGDVIVGSARGYFDEELPLAAYRVRVAHGETVETHVIDLQGPLDLGLPLPFRISAAPLYGTRDKQELITEPIVEASRRPDSAPGYGSGLFVALREQYGPFGGQLDGSLVIYPLGFLYLRDAERIEAPPGMYEMVYYGPGGVQTERLSIPIAKGWDTQVFIVVRNGKPILERASIFMQQAGKGFDPTDALIDAYELALADLVTGGPGPDHRTMIDLLNGKFRNPLFGLVGAHFLVRELQASRQGNPEGLALLNVVIGNMERLLGEDAPDVCALRVLRARLRGEEHREASVWQAPLLRASMLALVEATASDPILLNPWLNRVVLGASANSPWTFSIVPEPAFSTTGSHSPLRDELHHRLDGPWDRRMGELVHVLTEEGFDVRVSGTPEKARVEASAKASATSLSFEVLDSLAVVPDSVIEAVEAEIARSARLDQPLPMAALVRRLGLPRGLLEQAIRIGGIRSSADRFAIEAFPLVHHDRAEYSAGPEEEAASTTGAEDNEDGEAGATEAGA